MNPDFLPIIAASAADRRDLFLTTANRLGTPLQNVEKDFWVTWMLDLLFNGRDAREPRLLFKGGTSLSKSYGLISRFSEDIDITFFREDIGQTIEISDLEKLSGKQQRMRLDAIRHASENYLLTLKNRLEQQIEAAIRTAGIASVSVQITPDGDDAQTLLVQYPAVDMPNDSYVRPSVKIEAGAKSALDPHGLTRLQPYLAADIPSLNLNVENVVTIHAERTFWDKVIILHGQFCWFQNRGELQRNGHRVSRHYYDLYQLMHTPVGQRALADFALAQDCAHHALMFFNRPDYGLNDASHGKFTLAPTPEMAKVLARDYHAMQGMIFGEVPNFQTILDAMAQLEQRINMSASGA
ncbi:MAG: nucleotidyl transferase AbiEii/AbiGii toxin family protein [Gallionella sp.]